MLVVHGPDLFRLARQLLKIAVHATPDSGFRELPTSVRIVLVDIHENPDSTIGQIVARTGFPQSHVSSAVARLRDSGAVVTADDPTDRRRTIVRPARRRGRPAPGPGTRALDEVVADVLARNGDADPEAATAEVLAALEVLARHLTPPPITQCTPGDRTC